MLLACLRPWHTLALTSPQITGVGVADGTVRLSWTSVSDAYEVQSSTDLASASWRTVLATSRNNVELPQGGAARFFRVVATDTNAVSLLVTATNMSTGDVFRFASQPHTNTDWVLTVATNIAGVDVLQVTLPTAELQKFDVQFDPTGGFTIVSTNGEPSGYGGWLASTPGPGSTEVSYTGFLTNGTTTVTFAAVTDPGIGPIIAAILLVAPAICLAEIVLTGIQCYNASQAAQQACALSFPFPKHLAWIKQNVVFSMAWTPTISINCRTECSWGPCIQ